MVCVASNSRSSGEVGQWFVWPAIVDQVVRLDSRTCVLFFCTEVFLPLNEGGIILASYTFSSPHPLLLFRRLLETLLSHQV